MRIPPVLRMSDRMIVVLPAPRKPLSTVIGTGDAADDDDVGGGGGGGGGGTTILAHSVSPSLGVPPPTLMA